MSCPVSAEMKEAVRLIREEGLTRYAAAKRAGVTISGITRSRPYRDYLKVEKERAKKARL